MTLLLIRFHAFDVDLNDPSLKDLPFWLLRCLEAVDETGIMPPDSSEEEGYCPDPEPAYELEGYFYSLPHFFSIWNKCRINVKNVRHEESIQYDDRHPMLPWFDKSKKIEPPADFDTLADEAKYQTVWRF